MVNAKISTLIIEVTSKCNLRCTYCIKADKTYDDFPFVNTDLTDDRLAELYAFCKANDIRSVSLSGIGETAQFEGWADRLTPFLDDPDIVVYLVSNFARPLQPSDLAALRKVNVLQISFDSADPEMVRLMRSKARLLVIVDNIRQMKAAGGPFLVVNCTLTRENIGHIAPLAVLCRELGVDRLLVGEMMLNNPSTWMSPLGVLEGELMSGLVADIRAARETLEGTSTEFELQPQLARRLESLPPLTAPCSQPWDTPFIRSDGKVFPCCCYGDHFAPVGDLAVESLGKIYEGEPIKKVRAALLAGERPLLCDGCTLALPISQEEFIAGIKGRFT